MPLFDKLKKLQEMGYEFSSGYNCIYHDGILGKKDGLIGVLESKTGIIKNINFKMRENIELILLNGTKTVVGYVKNNNQVYPVERV